MANTTVWPDPDSTHTGYVPTPQVTYLLDPTTGKAISPATGSGGGGAVTVADGADTAQGTTTDAANANTVVGQLKQISTNTTTPNISDRWSRQVGQVDLARVLGAGLSNTNPVPIETNIQNWMRNGQVFSAQIGPIASGAQTSGLSIFNANTAKNALIFAIHVMNSSGGQAVNTQVFKTTTNPALGSLVTPTNNNFSSSTTSSMTCSSATTGVALSGTVLLASNFNTNSTQELLIPGASYLLPASATTGIAVQTGQGGTGGTVSITVLYAEY